MTTYVVEVGAEYGERLTAIIRAYDHLQVGEDLVDLGDGRFRLSNEAVDTLWEYHRPEDDGYLDDNDRLWFGGDWFPLRPEDDEASAEEISSAEEWANALDREMERTGQDPGTLISFGYSNGRLCGIELDPQNPKADDERAIIAATNGWIVGYDPQTHCWIDR